MREDKVVYDQRKFDLEKELMFLRKKINIVSREEKVVGEETDRAKKVYEKLVGQLEAEARERREHLDSLALSISAKQEMRDISSLRESQIAEIAERAMQDKDEN